MFITSLQFIILLYLCYPTLRLSTKHNMMLEEQKIAKKQDDVDWKIMNENRKKEGFFAGQLTVVADLGFIFLYRQTGGNTEIVLLTIALFFSKVAALPINYITSYADCIRETEVRKRRMVSTNTELIRGDCSEDWFQFHEKCYHVSTETRNHEVAKRHCSSMNAKLVNIERKNENDFVRSLANMKVVTRSIWIARQSTTNSYNNWELGQPRSNSNCVLMCPHNKWRVFDCGQQFAFVCERSLTESITERQELLALLVPILSCLTVAISFTAALLVSSIRRGSEPFKVSSRYRRTKKERKTTTFRMTEIVRRASLRRSLKLKSPTSSAPGIEITEVQKNYDETAQNEVRKKFSWGKREDKKTSLPVPKERRYSSTSSTSGNSSLYELLARLNKMEFEPSSETALNKNEREVDIVKDGKTLDETYDYEECFGDSNGQLVDSRGSHDDVRKPSESSFRNMAFRHSIASVDIHGNEIISVQNTDDRNITTDISSEDHDVTVCERVREESRDSSEWNNDNHCAIVQVDVHHSLNDNNRPENTTEQRNNVIWTYSL